MAFNGISRGVGSSVETGEITDNSVTLAKLADGTQGDILIYGASGAPTLLSAGTSGQFLQTQGAAANPVWGNLSASNPEVVGNISASTTTTTDTSIGTYSISASDFAATDLIRITVRVHGNDVNQMDNALIYVRYTANSVNNDSVQVNMSGTGGFNDGTAAVFILSQDQNDTSQSVVTPQHGSSEAANGKVAVQSLLVDHTTANILTTAGTIDIRCASFTGSGEVFVNVMIEKMSVPT